MSCSSSDTWLATFTAVLSHLFKHLNVLSFPRSLLSVGHNNIIIWHCHCLQYYHPGHRVSSLHRWQNIYINFVIVAPFFDSLWNTVKWVVTLVIGLLYLIFIVAIRHCPFGTAFCFLFLFPMTTVQLNLFTSTLHNIVSLVVQNSRT